jgi:tRNA(His) 5'-end guanylyltransferase
MTRPYDERLWQVFCDTVHLLCKNIQGVDFAYFQSDEISLVMSDFQDVKTEAWFANNLQKLVSVSASMATAAFNASVPYHFTNWRQTPPALFDSRAFVLPEQSEVFNYIYWRFRDCWRNSILNAGQSKFSQAQLHQKNTDMIQEMLFQEHGINWAKDFPSWNRNGTLCYKDDDTGEWIVEPCMNLKEYDGKAFLLSMIPYHKPYELDSHGYV